MQIYKSKDHSKKQCWRWRMLDASKKIIGRSEEAFTRAAIGKVVKAIMKACLRGKVEYYRDKNSHWRWRLRASNGEVVAISPGGHAKKSGAIGQAKAFRNRTLGRKVCK